MARRMRGLYKRGAVWWCCYKSASGRIVRESTGKTEHDEAVKFLVKRQGEVADGQAPELKKIINHNFCELAEKYIIWAERQNSFATKKRFVEQLQQKFGDLPLRGFSTFMIEEFQTARMQQGKARVVMRKQQDGTMKPIPMKGTPNGNRPATINRLLATLKHMFTKAVEWDMVEEEALKRVRKVKLLKENNRRLRYLSKDECRSLVSACHEDHVRAIVTVALNTGMRKGEILGLRWENVDLKHGFILLDKTKNGDRREIPMNAAVKLALQGVTRRLDIAHVFYDSDTEKPYQDVKKGFNGACRRAGIRDFHFHDLRHTFASHLVMAGVDITTVKELLGHKTLTMTLRYAHLAPSHKVQAVDKLDLNLEDSSTSHLLHISTGKKQGK